MPRARRSCLTVPGDDERKLARAAAVRADEVILDLEDAVAPARKDEARAIVERALRDLRFAATTVAIRINRGSIEDLALVRAVQPDVVVLPKVESPDELAGLPVPAEAQIETARGLVECERIAAAPGLEALVLGPGDLAASLGIPELTIGEGAHVEHALLRVVVAARAFGLAAIDGPYVEARRSRRSASCCHALARARLRRQVVHPPRAGGDVQPGVRAHGRGARARAQDPRASTASRRLDGEMIDEANRRMAEAILARAGRDCVTIAADGD